MNEILQTKRVAWRRIGQVVYWIIPVIILTIIFRRIDMAEFVGNIGQTNLLIAGLGLACYPVIMLIGAARWQSALAAYMEQKPALGFMFKHYCIGQTLGLFGPASVGWDIYRAVIAGREYRRYDIGIAAILVERIIALVNIVALVLLFYPLASGLFVENADLVRRVVRIAGALLAASSLMLAGVAVVQHHRVINLAARKLERMLARTVSRVRAYLGGAGAVVEMNLSVPELVRPLVRFRPFFRLFMISTVLQVFSGITVQILFRAVGYELPLIANLFIVPVLFLVFILPISFGGLGIREATYILLYGLFGVPKEVALLVSFLDLAGVLLNQAIGAVLIWTGRSSPSCSG